MLGLVIFDCDGVLVDSEPISSAVFVQALKEIGLEMTVDDCIKTFVGRPVEINLAQIEAMLGRPLPPEFAPQLMVKANEAFARDLRPIKGIEIALNAISAQKCVASGSGPDLIETNLKITGLFHHFQGRIFSTSHVARAKPAPDVFLHAAKTLAIAPEYCAVIEDSIAGVQAGRAAGMKVFAYTGTFPADTLKKEGSHVVFDDMSKLPDLLRVHCG